jgi:signal transduction histidine kinase
MNNSISEGAVASLRHELRTCLNQTGGYCDLIRDELPAELAATVDGHLTSIMDRSDELLELITERLGQGRAVGVGDVAAVHDSARQVCRKVRVAVAALRSRLDAEEHAGALADVAKIEQATRRWEEQLSAAAKPHPDSC